MIEQRRGGGGEEEKGKERMLDSPFCRPVSRRIHVDAGHVAVPRAQ